MRSNRALWTLCVWAFVFSLCLTGSATAAETAAVQLIFGSFRAEANATNWAIRVARTLDHPVRVEETADGQGGVWYRVVSEVLAAAQADHLDRRATAERLTFWRRSIAANRTSVIARSAPAPTAAQKRSLPPAATPVAPVEPNTPSESQDVAVVSAPAPSVAVPAAVADDSGDVEQVWNLDLGGQLWGYLHEGRDGQSRLPVSVSAELDYRRTWDGGRQSLVFTPFVRYDSEDHRRSHADVRELFWSWVGERTDVHAGVRQVFWGVSEFTHLVDIVNQTDLVENIDGEDKLGQPMVHVSMLRDWGILDAYALLGFRERTFAGRDGRLRSLVVDVDDATYASSAQEKRVDLALRYAHHIGPVDFGVHVFSGTSRDPLWRAALRNGEVRLQPHYPVIDQAGLDAQWIHGDWAFKLEGISRSGFGPRYVAANLGFEKTVVGAFGTRADLGLVGEYLFDERGEDAFDTLFENDIAIGTRLRLNDLADTEALLGLIWDAETDEYVFSLEASRRLGDDWTLVLEGRAFGGARRLPGNLTPAETVAALFDAENRSAWFARDDYIQLEFTRYF